MMTKKQLIEVLDKLACVIKYFTSEDYSRKSENMAYIELGSLHTWISLELQNMEDDSD